MGKPRVWAIVRLPDGRIVKKPVDFRGTEKLERKMYQDTESKLWLYKQKYRYIDQKNADS